MGLYENRIGDYRNILVSGKKEYPFYIEQVGTDNCSPAYYLERNKSPLAVIGFTTKGSGQIIVDGKNFITYTGTIFILPSNSTHRYFPISEWSFSWFNIVGEINQFLDMYGLLEQTIYSAPNVMEKFVSTVNKCVLAEDGLMDAQLIGQSFIVSLLPYLKFYSLNKHENTLAEKLKIALEKQCFIDFNLQEECSKIGITLRHAQRIFKSEFGLTPHEYVLSLRFRDACALLSNSNLTVQEIAYAVGFHDSKYFSNFFKTRSGISPHLYRKLIRK